jgi:hypothetical protein
MLGLANLCRVSVNRDLVRTTDAKRLIQLALSKPDATAKLIESSLLALWAITIW